MEQKEAQLIQRILQGDQDAFSRLVKNIRKGFTHLRGGRSVIFTSHKKLRKMRFSLRIRNLEP